MTATEVTVLDTWNTLGMRGTGSLDIMIDGLFVPDDKIPLGRTAGEWHPGFQLIATMAFPLIYAVYLGIAESAREIALAIAGMKPVSHRLQSIAERMRERADRRDPSPRGTAPTGMKGHPCHAGSAPTSQWTRSQPISVSCRRAEASA